MAGETVGILKNIEKDRHIEYNGEHMMKNIKKKISESFLIWILVTQFLPKVLFIILILIILTLVSNFC
jgi:hypothetical protein